MTILYVLYAILILGLIVLAHELGHYLVGRATGMSIVEFSVGFGPKLLGFQKSGIQYSLRLIPLGGYCMFNGEDEKSDDPRSMRNQSVWKRFLTIAAGPAMNFLLAFLAAVLLIWGYGFQENAPVVGTLSADSAAAQAGMLEGDVIESVNGERLTLDIEGAERLIGAIQGADDKTAIDFIVSRDGQTIPFTVTPRFNEKDGAYQIGIILGVVNVRFGFFRSVALSGDYVVYVLKAMLTSLKALVTTGEGLSDTMGPVGIIGFMSKEVRSGFDTVLYLIILISMNLGIMNLIPFPGLDGSRLVFLAVEGVRRKPIDPNKEGWVHGIGLILLLGLIVVISYRDIVRLITGG